MEEELKDVDPMGLLPHWIFQNWLYCPSAIRLALEKVTFLAISSQFSLLGIL